MNRPSLIPVRAIGAAPRPERGATFIELAVVLPLFTLLVLTVFDTCRYVAQEAALDHATRLAARHGARLIQSDCLSPAADRFFELTRRSLLTSGATLRADIVALADGTPGLQVTTQAGGMRFLSFGPRARSAALLPVEFIGSCAGRQSLPPTQDGP